MTVQYIILFVKKENYKHRSFIYLFIYYTLFSFEGL